MRTKIVEAEGGGFYLKALLIRFGDEEWSRPSLLAWEVAGMPIPLLAQEGWGTESFYICLLSASAGGAMFNLKRRPEDARYDVEKAPAVT